MRRGLALLLIIGLISACNLLNQGADASPNPSALTALAPDTSGKRWETIAPGVDVLEVAVPPPYSSRSFDMLVVRLDPTQVSFRVHYESGTWFTFDEWANRLDNPLVFINASFFTELGYAVGLVVADGNASGQSLVGYGGMFQVMDGEARVRSLVQEAYAGETFEQAVQGFPMFVEPGGVAASTGAGFDDPSRRTIIAQGSDGSIYFMSANTGLMTLRQVMNWLLASDFSIDVAFGLDGGKSTGVYLANGTVYPSIDPVSVVLAVYPR